MPGIVVTNAQEFAASLDKFLSNTERRIDWTMGQAAEEMCSQIIGLTPVDITEPDNVVMKGDWVSGIDEEPVDALRGDASGDGANHQLREVTKKWHASKGQRFVFANHRPYGVMLEYGQYSHDHTANPARTTAQGYSTQAPAGMVRVSVQDFDFLVDDYAKRAEAMK
jgi:hypothetical protein